MMGRVRKSYRYLHQGFKENLKFAMLLLLAEPHVKYDRSQREALEIREQRRDHEVI